MMNEMGAESPSTPRAGATEFIQTLFPEIGNEFLELRLIYSPTDIRQSYHRSAENLVIAASRHIATGKPVAVYFGACARATRLGDKSAVKQARSLWVDLDGKLFAGGKEEALAVLGRFPIRPTAIVDSGNGYHAYWRLKEAEATNSPEDVAGVEAYLRGLARALGGDVSPAEIARVMRLPGSVNWKNPSNPLPVSVLELNSSLEYNLCDFDEFVVTKTGAVTEHRNSPGWIGEAFQNLHDGNRNDSLTRIVGKLHRERWTPQDIIELLTPHAERTGYPKDELIRQVHGIVRRYSLPAFDEGEDTVANAEPPEYLAIRLDEFLTQAPEKIDWCIEGVLPVGGVGIIGAPAGWAKTFMAMDLAIECTRGGKWLGRFQTKQMTVLYIDEESPPGLFQIRMRKLLRGKQLNPGSVDVHVLYQNAVMLTDKRSLAKLRRLLAVLRPGLIIFDALVRVHDVDENSATEMARVSAIVKKLIRDSGCTVLFTDHQRKPSQFGASGLTGDQRLRGSSEKVALCDSLISLLTKTREGNREIYTIEHSKSRGVLGGPNLVVYLEDPTQESTSIYVADDAEAVKQSGRMNAAARFLESALQPVETGEWMTRKELIERGKKAGIGHQQIDDVLNNWEEIERVERDDFKPSKGRGGKAAHYRWNPDYVPIPSPVPTPIGVGTENVNIESRENGRNLKTDCKLDPALEIEDTYGLRLRSGDGDAATKARMSPSRGHSDCEGRQVGVHAVDPLTPQENTDLPATPFSVPIPYKEGTGNGIEQVAAGTRDEADPESDWETGTL